jgi:hypothetical protein
MGTEDFPDVAKKEEFQSKVLGRSAVIGVTIGWAGQGTLIIIPTR